MAKGPKIDNKTLLQAGLDLMEQNGKTLSELQSFRAMLYALPNGETVRVRTCNDHILIVLAERASAGAKLNIEGTDWLLVVMPEEERTPGKVLAYLVPTRVAVEAARSTHKEWLATKPNTNGGNKTWNLWFDKGPVFAEKWKQYLLNGDGKTAQSAQLQESVEPGSVKTEVETARLRISQAAGVPLDAVRITIEFGL
jgi:hypothetical protein